MGQIILEGASNHRIILTVSQQTWNNGNGTGTTQISWNLLYDIPAKGHLKVSAPKRTEITINGQKKVYSWTHSNINDQRDFYIASDSMNITRTIQNSNNFSVSYSFDGSDILGPRKDSNGYNIIEWKNCGQTGSILTDNLSLWGPNGYPGTPQVPNEIVEDESFTITWAAPTIGTGNSISKYEVFYKFNDTSWTLYETTQNPSSLIKLALIPTKTISFYIRSYDNRNNYKDSNVSKEVLIKFNACKMFLENRRITQMFLGQKPIKKVYLGNTLIFKANVLPEKDPTIYEYINPKIAIPKVSITNAIKDEYIITPKADNFNTLEEKITNKISISTIGIKGRIVDSVNGELRGINIKESDILPQKISIPQVRIKNDIIDIYEPKLITPINSKIDENIKNKIPISVVGIKNKIQDNVENTFNFDK